MIWVLVASLVGIPLFLLVSILWLLILFGWAVETLRALKAVFR